MTWKMPGSLSDCMEPSSSNLPTELCWTVMWTSTFIGVPRNEILVEGFLGKGLTFTTIQTSER